MTLYVIFGAPDPEAQAARELCESCRVSYGQAVSFLTSRDVSAADAYEAENWRSQFGLPLRAGSRVLLFECDGDGLRKHFPAGCYAVRLDHHRPLDRGWGKPPAEFWPASSLGQLVAELARDGLLKGEGPEAGDLKPGTSVWDAPSATWRVATRQRTWWTVPTDYVLAAAADHCLAAAYRGECPGVEPDQLMAWRIKSRAEFQGRPVEALMADVERAREALRQAPKIDLGGELVADLRGQVVPELPEAAAREGVAFLATPPVRAGERRKVVLQCAGPAALTAWRPWAIAQGLVDLYGGDASRGFAGGYIPDGQTGKTQA
jgi:hypothetical protein